MSFEDETRDGADVVWGRIVGLCFWILAVLVVGGLADLLGLIS